MIIDVLEIGWFRRSLTRSQMSLENNPSSDSHKTQGFTLPILEKHIKAVLGKIHLEVQGLLVKHLDVYKILLILMVSLSMKTPHP